MDKKLAQIVFDEFGIETTVTLTRPDVQFGDYATNVALQIAKQVGKNPREIAEQIVSKLDADDEVEGVNVAGPGFINITLSADGLISLVKKYPTPQRGGQSIVVETNNPNPFKAMHIGHAMNAIVADTVANLLALDGAHVYRVSYHGDVGLHVGKSMYSLLKYADGDFSKIESIPEDERNSFMSKMYAEGSAAYKDDPQAKAEINDLSEQSFAPKTALYVQIYDLCKAWSFEQIDKTVARLGNLPTERRFLESDADMRGVETVKKHTPGVFQISDGAYVFEGSKYGAFDNAFVASNGRGLYAARDLGLMQLKNEYFHPNHSYIITGSEQAGYFKGVIAAAEQCLPELKGVTINIPTGLVKLTTGKMSSRSGDVLEISWLFDQFADAIKERGGEPDEEIIAGALRYQFLKTKIGGDVVFDVNEAVSLTGNTGSYLQYAHARARRILENSASTPGWIEDVKPEDRALVRKLSEYVEVTELAKKNVEPHHICNYLFELAQEFNRYYEKNRVVGSELEAHRVNVTLLYADILKAGLTTLGIHAPDKM